MFQQMMFKLLMAMGAFHSEGIELPVSFYSPEEYFEEISENKISDLFKEIRVEVLLVFRNN